ncbi:hypothetical protein FRC18_002863 [Serendipita sp. 400]|nr:hypothetical protein FRC18_002863 [Serendipita sp. 400]
MPKKKASSGTTSSGKAAAKASKKAKAAAKVERKETKKVKAANTVTKGKSKAKSKDDDDDDDLEGILARMQKEWELAHTVTEETADGPPSRRANATLTPCPINSHLWCIGGEYFSDDGKAYFYNDVYRYSPEKDEWRKFASPTCPGPRSAHAVVASPASGGKLFLFGGEFSSLYQNSFHHYRDFWVFDIQSHLWDRIETKVRPTGRSGHRMILWKHYIVLFGGFIDPGVRTNYLQDLWVFDTQEYKWQQIEFRDNERRPSPRSGFSFLAVPDGAILHGGYCKEYVKGKRPQGIALDDTWLLKMDSDLKNIKWEKRKKIGYAPSIRSGCTMVLWSAKGIGVLFGGVYDDDKDEETLESVFYNDLYGYQTSGNGRWISMALRKPKKKPGGGGKKAKKPHDTPTSPTKIDVKDQSDDENYEYGANDSENEVENPPNEPSSPTLKQKRNAAGNQGTHPGSKVASGVVMQMDEGVDPDDPTLTTPLIRYNAMLAVLKNTLYIYGGIYERGAREYTLDDFILSSWTSWIDIPASRRAVSEEEDEEDPDRDSNNDEKEEVSEAAPKVTQQEVAPPEDEEVSHIRKKAQALLKLAETSSPPLQSTSSEPVPSQTPLGDAHVTPLPGETLATFYTRTKDHWAQKARAELGSENRGKSLRRDGFALAEERWTEYKPILEEIERIRKEAGIDEESSGIARTAGAGKGVGESRNRR